MLITLLNVLMNEHTRAVGGVTHMDTRKDPRYELHLDCNTGMVHAKHPKHGWTILHISSCIVTVDPDADHKRPRGRPRKSVPVATQPGA